jgi:hypothetical protein
MSTVATKLPNLYKSPMPFWNFIFPNGKKAVFSQGQYMTIDPYEIEQLNGEVSKNHPMIYVDPNEIVASEERFDPMIGLRKRIAEEERARILAEMEAAINPNRDMGESENQRLTPASTTDIAPVTANGDAAARLSALRKPIVIADSAK